MGMNWQLVTIGKLILHEFCSQATSKLEEYGDVSQMVERSLSMREVRGSMTRIPKTFLRIRQFWFFLLMMGRNWQLVTNRKPIFHELCWEASSKRNHCGDAAQMVERSLSMREVRGSMRRISKTFFRIRQFCFLFGDIGNELTTRYKAKTDFSWIVFRS